MAAFQFPLKNSPPNASDSGTFELTAASDSEPSWLTHANDPEMYWLTYANEPN